MILYNTLMGVCAGLALILVPMLARKLYTRQAVSAEGWALTFGIIGLPLTFLSALMATTWPLTANPPINIIFAEPSLVLGVLLLGASVYLWRSRDTIAALGDGNKKAADAAEVQLTRTLAPVSWIVFALGLMLAACTAAIFRFMLVGGAPEQEPITGLLYDKPEIENTFFGIIYGLAALGALAAPFALRARNSIYVKVMFWAWMISGVTFLLFSVMNYYTHTGMLVNLLQGKDYEF
jgi:hypothetical protein